MVLDVNTELKSLDALGIADTVIGALLLNYSSKFYKINNDNILENQKIISLLNDINKNEKTIISLLEKMVDN
nr:MAG TPA: hypothetical protein [Caudoviricetes sp.]